MNPIHPALAPLAQAAKAFAHEVRTTGRLQSAFMDALRAAVGARTEWLRPEHRVGDPARVSARFFAEP